MGPNERAGGISVADPVAGTNLGDLIGSLLRAASCLSVSASSMSRRANVPGPAQPSPAPSSPADMGRHLLASTCHAQRGSRVGERAGIPGGGLTLISAAVLAC